MLRGGSHVGLAPSTVPLGSSPEDHSAACALHLLDLVRHHGTDEPRRDGTGLRADGRTLLIEAARLGRR